MPKKWKRADITPEVLRELLHLDEETGKLYWKERGPEWFFSGGRNGSSRSSNTWNSRYAGKEVDQRVNNKGSIVIRVFGVALTSNIVLYMLKSGKKPNGHVTNVFGNLIDISPSTKCAIFNGRAGKGSYYRGVSTVSERDMGIEEYKKRPYVVSIANNNVGRYATPIEAARAYDKAAFEKWGEHARLNFPEEYGLAPKEDE